MFKNKRFFSNVAVLVLCFTAVAVQADEEGPLPSFGQNAGVESIEQNINVLATWARGEYAEHEVEGLFTAYPEDAAVIQASMRLVDDLISQAKQAKSSGDTQRAHALFLSAEATARYAVHMPHLLEKRVSETNQSN